MTLLVMNLAAKSGKSGWLDGGGSGVKPKIKINNFFTTSDILC